MIKIVKWNLVWQFVGTVLIPLLYLTNIFIAFNNPYSFNATFSLVLLGIIFAFLGLTLWIASYINLRGSFGVLPQKQKRVRTGVYKYFNHPMYIAIWLTFLGISLANASWQALVFLNVAITPLLFVRAHFEDKKLVN
ncbi:MAG: methyltransferase [Patescibacteria group bacterium]